MRALACLALLVAGPAVAADYTTACGRWTVDTNAGFEGGETAAVLDCRLGETEWRPLHVGCGDGEVMLRFAPKAPELMDGSRPEPTVRLDFDGPVPSAAVSARYEEAMPDFAAYLAPAAAAPVVEGLRRASAVTVTVGDGPAETYPLAGSSAAVGRIAKACGVR